MSRVADIGLCPICRTGLDRPPAVAPDATRQLHCPNCGVHRLTEQAEVDVEGWVSDASVRARLAHAVRKRPAGSLLTVELLTNLLRTATLPPAQERIDNLLAHLATHFAPGQRGPMTPKVLRAVVGAESVSEVEWVLEEALRAHLITSPHPSTLHTGDRTLPQTALTIEGWTRHESRLRSGVGSRHAFMAMKFGDSELDTVFRKHMCKAVKDCDFELRTTAGDHQTAGSIDDRMRVEIRTSRFLVCDLTHGNRGAYWEAGFAEGIGRPVFFTCRRAEARSADPAIKPHFDTAHQLIVEWDLATIDADMHALKNAIRATLPVEARMEDGLQP